MSFSPEKLPFAALLAVLLTGLLFAIPATAGIAPPPPPNVPASSDSVGAAGITDQVRAASLLVPYFQVGIDTEFDPDDTLLVVTNRSSSAQRIHLEVWDIDGNAVGIQDNRLLPANDSHSYSMRALIADGGLDISVQLIDGAFFRGFVTIDGVTANTGLTPVDGSYPFDDDNVLTGWMYYTRLQNGSANGLPMVHLEHVGSTIDSRLRDFYTNGVDNREEMDNDSRQCAAARIAQATDDPVTSCVPFDDESLSELTYRTFIGGGLNGATRVVLFAWTDGGPDGPSVLCDTRPCDSEYAVYLYDEAGNAYDSAFVRFDHVVNVIDLEPGDGVNGFLVIRDLPDVLDDTQVYGFAFNSAQPADATLNWDAIFEATIIP